MDPLSAKVEPEPVLKLAHHAVKDQKLVYLIAVQTRWRYQRGSSHIIYIGTTRKGLDRIADSIAKKAQQIFDLHDVHGAQVHVVTCGPRQRVKTWLELERALLVTFRKLYGELPELNKKGKKLPRVDPAKFFNPSNLESIVKQFEELQSVS